MSLTVPEGYGTLGHARQVLDPYHGLGTYHREAEQLHMVVVACTKPPRRLSGSRLLGTTSGYPLCKLYLVAPHPHPAHARPRMSVGGLAWAPARNTAPSSEHAISSASSSPSAWPPWGQCRRGAGPKGRRQEGRSGAKCMRIPLGAGVGGQPRRCCHLGPKSGRMPCGRDER